MRRYYPVEQIKESSMIEKNSFGEYELYTITNDELTVSVCTLGAIVKSIQYQGEEVTLGYTTPEEYLNATSYVGAIVGRCANRIEGATFELNGEVYHLTKNENNNHLHGGIHAFDRQVWNAEIVDNQTIALTLFSPDGDNGYPGNLQVKVTYHVEDSTLCTDIVATSDKDTIFMPTSHLYFNLGHLASCLDMKLQINADSYLPVNEYLLPLANKATCEGIYDFHTLRKVEHNYDNCFVLNDKNAVKAVGGNIQLDMETDFPGVQIYTGEFLDGGYQANEGLAIEPVFFPNSANRPDYPSIVLRRGDVFHKYAKYHFQHIKE